MNTNTIIVVVIIAVVLLLAVFMFMNSNKQPTTQGQPIVNQQLPNTTTLGGVASIIQALGGTGWFNNSNNNNNGNNQNGEVLRNSFNNESDLSKTYAKLLLGQEDFNDIN